MCTEKNGNETILKKKTNEVMLSCLYLYTEVFDSLRRLARGKGFSLHARVIYTRHNEDARARVS